MIEAEPDKTLVVHEFKAGSNGKALDAAMKQYKNLSPKTAVMLFSADHDEGKVVCMGCVPKVSDSFFLFQKLFIPKNIQ